MSDTTITMPLEEYNEMKARIHALETTGFYSKRYLRNSHPLIFESGIRAEFKDKLMDDLAEDNNYLRSVNEQLATNLEKIPSFIRKIFGA